MTYYEEIYDIAADDYGLISSATAKKMGVPIIELVKLAERGRLIRIGYGQYRLARYTPSSLDVYAQAVAVVGEGAYLYGESVIAMHNLAPTNPKFLYVATPKRVRKSLPNHIVVVRRNFDEEIKNYEGIPSQNVFDAIKSCKGVIMPDRLRDATHRARQTGLITNSQCDYLIKELANEKDS